MQLTLIGASGGTGRALLRQALDAGHQVTALVRDAERLPPDLRARLHATVEADATADTAAVERAVRGRAAVISVVGTRDLKLPTTVCADTARTLVTAVRAVVRAAAHDTADTAPPGASPTSAAPTGAARTTAPLIVLASNSAMAPGPGDDPLTRFVVKPALLGPLLKHMLADMRAAEEVVRGSGLAWTAVRAGRLTDRPGRGRYRSATDRNVLGGFQLTREDFARALLDAATDPARAGHTVSVG